MTEIWQIIEVCETVYDPEIDNEIETLITICPLDGDYYDSEIFTFPLNEKAFWESQIGKTFDMTEKIHKGFNKGADPILDLKALKKAVVDCKEKVDFT